MAQITYENKVALNENPNINAINKVQDTDMNQIKEVVNENETKILLAVTDTEPTECSTGDRYYNTTDDLIYTATATDTWSSTGVAPTENTLYVVLTTQTSYMYDGNTLVSIGGGTGSSDIVIVDPDTPVADTKLYIESTDLDFQGLEISDEYTTGDNVTYSADYVNGIIESGSNTNGVYTKFADGTLICRTTTTPSGTQGNPYIATWTFPYPFIDINYTVTGNALAGNSKAYTTAFTSATTTNIVIHTKCLGTNGTAETCDRGSMCIAIGRWM